MPDHQIEVMASVIFALALLHTFAATAFERLARRHPQHARLFHLLGEVEIIFGFWALILVCLMAGLTSNNEAINYVGSRHFTEPLFVFVIMVVAASLPILNAVRSLIKMVADALPINSVLTQTWLSLAVVPLLGSFITEPAAMTIAALILSPLAFNKSMPEWLKYVPLATLFVNVSIGGTLTAYAAPPVLMVANAWQWDSAFMAYTFGWKAAIAVIINASMASLLLSSYITTADASTETKQTKIPLTITFIHVTFLATIVVFAHHPIVFFGLFLLFIGFTQAYAQYQSRLLLKEGLLVGLFLAALVILGGLQQWWLQPIVSSFSPIALFWGATALTAVIDNAALTYLSAQTHGLTEVAKYMLMAGAVTGGGLTLIANAPNPAGAALLKHQFREGVIHPGLLLLAALPPTLIAAALFLL